MPPNVNFGTFGVKRSTSDGVASGASDSGASANGKDATEAGVASGASGASDSSVSSRNRQKRVSGVLNVSAEIERTADGQHVLLTVAQHQKITVIPANHPIFSYFLFPPSHALSTLADSTICLC